jgi:hypothetical protein
MDAAGFGYFLSLCEETFFLSTIPGAVMTRRRPSFFGFISTHTSTVTVLLSMRPDDLKEAAAGKKVTGV